MQDALKYFIDSFIRLLAAVVDLILICSLAIFLLTLSIYASLPFNLDYAYFLFGLAFVIYSGIEGSYSRAIGKRATGLMLEIAGPWPARMFLVLFRNLIKGLMLFGLYSLILIYQKYFYTQSMSESVLTVSSLTWLIMTGSLYLFKTNRQPQDWLTGTQVVKEQPHLPYWQQSFNLIGAGFGCFAIWMLLMIGIQHRPYDGRSQPSSVKANMHTLQTVVETYAVDWGGVYAKDLTALKYEATRPGREYWKEFTNPYTGKSGAHRSYSNKLPPADQPDQIQQGQVIYTPVISDGAIIRYFIYGLDGSGRRIQDKGKDLTLSNS